MATTAQRNYVELFKTWVLRRLQAAATATCMAALGILREYAKKSIPSPSLPSSILFAHTDATLTIFDAFPKASPDLMSRSGS